MHALTFPSSGSVKFLVTITPVSGQFEVSENDGLVVSGKIYVPNEPILEVPVYEKRSIGEDDSTIHLTTRDIYKELRLRGYDYGGMFQGILSATTRGQHSLPVHSCNVRGLLFV